MLPRRLIDLITGFVWGIGGGVFAFLLGFLFGKISILGYSIAIITDN